MKSLIKMGFYGPPFLLQNAVLEFSIAADPEVPEDQDERETDTEIRKEARVNYREFSRAQYREGDREGQRELADDHVLKTQSKKSATSAQTFVPKSGTQQPWSDTIHGRCAHLRSPLPGERPGYCRCDRSSVQMGATAVSVACNCL